MQSKVLKCLNFFIQMFLENNVSALLPISRKKKKHFVEFPERHSCQMSTVLDMEGLGWSEWSMIIELINRWEAVLIHTRKLIREIEHTHWNKHSLSTALWKKCFPLTDCFALFWFLHICQKSFRSSNKF